MGACLADAEVAAAFAPGDHASTFGGGPVQSAAALATLDVIETEGLVARSAELGAKAMERLGRSLGPDRVRGKGLLIGVDVGRPAARAIAQRALELGVLVNDCTPAVVRLAPPLVIGEGELDEALDVVARACDEVLRGGER